MATTPTSMINRLMGLETWTDAVTFAAAQTLPGTTVLPAGITTTFGSGTATFLEEGNINRQISATGINPGGTAADNVLASYSLPANSLDGTGNRIIQVTAWGTFAATANTKTVKLLWNPATATVGSTVGAGSTLICSTGAVTSNNLAWILTGFIWKYGAANANTQLGLGGGVVIGTTHGGVGANPTTATATENAAIFIAVTGNAATAVTDIVFNALEINACN